MSENKSPLLPSILKMKCPNCRKGNMYLQPSIFPMSSMMQMPERCSECSQKMELEVGFYYGTGYVSYALTVAIIAICFISYWLIIGMSSKDYSIFYALGTAIGIALLLQPLIMRYSRVIYLYMFVKYGKGHSSR
jgi:hypothetical protein